MNLIEVRALVDHLLGLFKVSGCKWDVGVKETTNSFTVEYTSFKIWVEWTHGFEGEKGFSFKVYTKGRLTSQGYKPYKWAEPEEIQWFWTTKDLVTGIRSKIEKVAEEKEEWLMEGKFLKIDVDKDF